MGIEIEIQSIRDNIMLLKRDQSIALKAIAMDVGNVSDKLHSMKEQHRQEIAKLQQTVAKLDSSKSQTIVQIETVKDKASRLEKQCIKNARMITPVSEDLNLLKKKIESDMQIFEYKLDEINANFEKKFDTIQNLVLDHINQRKS